MPSQVEIRHDYLERISDASGISTSQILLHARNLAKALKIHYRIGSKYIANV